MKLNLKLNTRYKRSIRKNIIFYVAASLLTMLCVMAFALLYTCGTGIRTFTQNIFETNVVEDANIQTIGNIEPEQIKELEQKYHIIMEKQEFINFLDAKAYDKNGNLSS